MKLQEDLVQAFLPPVIAAEGHKLLVEEIMATVPRTGLTGLVKRFMIVSVLPPKAVKLLVWVQEYLMNAVNPASLKLYRALKTDNVLINVRQVGQRLPLDQ